MREHFWSSRFSATRVSTVMYWFALCSISGTLAGGRSTNDQKNLEGQRPIRKAWIASEVYVSGTPRISFAKRDELGQGLVIFLAQAEERCGSGLQSSTSSSRWFTWRNCAQRESVESEEGVRLKKTGYDDSRNGHQEFDYGFWGSQPVLGREALSLGIGRVSGFPFPRGGKRLEAPAPRACEAVVLPPTPKCCWTLCHGRGVRKHQWEHHMRSRRSKQNQFLR
ncbi:hypothetical protein B296_00009853 [Ensete ventricosum]|uniref:Uncharacterized protein n=1 Tax=Ensete ventricosum TaxID=4639 RepID=A0A427AJZ0_ENSVE|nr:hypothetical protein B296_00009853 [Ensete ventricosum]